jgi:hypothetical protein
MKGEDMFKRDVVFRPARAISFQLTKDNKGIEFKVHTGWYLDYNNDCRPTNGGVTYHDTVPHHDEQTPVEDCKITGGDCYCYVDYTAGEILLSILMKKGSEAVWEKMEVLYRIWLERSNEPWREEEKE